MTDVDKLVAQAKSAIDSKPFDYTLRESGRRAIDVLAAERQQAIDERDAARKASDTQHGLFLKVVHERDVLRQREADLTLRCEQALDALREIARIGPLW